MNSVGSIGFLAEREALLAEHNLVADECCGDEREAGLPDPAVHQLAHGFVAAIGRGDGLDAVPQVAGLGVAVGSAVRR